MLESCIHAYTCILFILFAGMSRSFIDTTKKNTRESTKIEWSSLSPLEVVAKTTPFVYMMLQEEKKEEN